MIGTSERSKPRIASSVRQNIQTKLYLAFYTKHMLQ